MGELKLLEEKMIGKTYQLANCINPFIITLTTVDYLNEYFRCLFIKIEETKGIIEANRKAKNIFDVEQELSFTPHLSLMYRNFAIKKKKEIVMKIGDVFHISFEVQSIYLVLTSSNTEPKNWQKVRQFMF